MHIIIFIFFSLIIADESNEPFYNYKHDKVYSIINNGMIPLIDGRLNDPCWEGVEEIKLFTQEAPDYNAQPTEDTSVKIIQDEYAIYLSAYLYDSSPELIVQKFVNRDDFVKLSMSDWFSFSIDSHHDHQTGYEFIVNAAGIQFDSFLFDDIEEEMNWDGAWQSMVSKANDGWTIEMRIPFSSLRYSDYDGKSKWGMNIKRYIHRKNEYIEWVVLPKGTVAGVSKFGHLNNIQNAESERSIEVVPYISMGQMLYDDILLKDENKESLEAGYESYDTTYYYNKIGLDIKAHLSNNTILDFTTLPDFGQIESDPADINFTEYDTYFSEKRSFFLENITLFDSPIDLFHSRRIGENPNYEINQYQELEEALVLGAAKVTGKTESNISYGFIAAKTMSQKRNSLSNNMFSINIDQPTHNYLVGRLSKDVFSGNSYIGITATSFKNRNKKSSVFSYDGLYYLFDNNLYIDSQVIYSLKDTVGTGAFLEFEYSFPNLVQFGTSIEYYDSNLDINDIGYLIRNNLFKMNNVMIYKNEKMLSRFGIKDFDIQLSHVFAQNNTEKLLLSHILSSSLKINFNNYSFLDFTQIFTRESYEDRHYAFTRDRLYVNKIGKIPSSRTFQIDFGTDPNYKFYFDFTYAKTNTDIDEESSGYSFLLGANITEDSDLTVSFIKNAGNEKFSFLESLSEIIPVNIVKNHFIFANDKSIKKKFTLRYNKFFKNGINFQLYHEYFAESHKYDNYSELSMDSEYPSTQTDYILSDNFYCDVGDPNLDDAFEPCSLNPNDYIYYYPNYNELNLNLILSWEYSQRSNIYFIYKIRKSIIGKEITNYVDFVDYVDFLNYKHSEEHLSEIWNDQSIYVKVDYWFDF